MNTQRFSDKQWDFHFIKSYLWELKGKYPLNTFIIKKDIVWKTPFLNARSINAVFEDYQKRKKKEDFLALRKEFSP